MEALVSVHNKCFVSPWSAKDFHELLSLTSVSGFISYRTKETFDNINIPSGESEILSEIDLRGFILGLVASDQCEILTICVLPEWRRAGIANQLIDSLTTKIKKTGVKNIFLEVAENNLIARRLYINKGFKEFGTRTKYYSQGKERVDAIQLSKTISY